MANNVTFTINFEGNAEMKTDSLIRAAGTLKGVMSALEGVMVKVGARVAVFNQMADAVRSVAGAMAETSAPGMALDASMHDLSAITGVVGEQLKEIEGYARSAAKTFGGSAADSVDSYKLILSQLSPEIAKVPSALSAMGQSVGILSKTMGGDTAAAVEVLTTAMNQFQVSTDDPAAAAAEMARMMNVMAAAAQAGSAELPAIKAALEQSGMAAKSASVSFEETNAAIQVLDKAGKKASEGGVALRNILTTLAQGRFLPADTVQELTAAGINVDTLADKSLTLSERLAVLKPLLDDDALLAKLFGRETYNAALALISGTDAMDGYTAAVTGTRSAEEQAAIVMESRQEQLARYRARIDDLKIAMYSGLGGIYPYAQALSDVLVPVSQMLPLMDLLGSGLMKTVSLFKASAIAARMKSAAVTAATAATGLYRTALSALTVALGSARLATAALAATMTMGLSLAITGVISLVGKLKSGRQDLAEATGKAESGEDAYVQSVASARSELEMYMARLKDFSGSREQESAIVDELNGRYGDTLGIYGSVAAWYDTLVSKGGAYVGILVAEAKARRMADLVASQGMKVDSLQNRLDGTPATVERPGSAPVANPAYGLLSDMLEAEQEKLQKQKGELDNTVREIAEIRASLTDSGPKGTATGNKPDPGDSDAYARLEMRLAAIARANGIFGESSRTAADSVKAAKSAIESYISSGEVNEEVLQRMIALYRELVAQQYAASRVPLPKVDTSSISVRPASGSLQPDLEPRGLDRYARGMGNVGRTTSAVVEIMSSLSSVMNGVSGSLGSMAAQWINYGSSVMQAAAASVSAIAAAIAMQEKKNSVDALGVVLGATKSAADVPVVGWILAAATMASMIAAVLSIPKFAAGGVVSGPTMALVGEYPGASNNPEVIAPLSKLKSMLATEGTGGRVVFEIEGRKLVGILDKEGRRDRRTR